MKLANVEKITAVLWLAGPKSSLIIMRTKFVSRYKEDLRRNLINKMKNSKELFHITTGLDPGDAEPV